MSYSDFKFYSETAKGKLLESQYDFYVMDATAIIDEKTNGRAANAPSTMTVKVKMCECRLVDALSSFDMTSAGASESGTGGVQSVDNDGYRTTFANLADQKAAKTAATLDILRTWLRQPVNLLYKGVWSCA